MFRSAWDRGNRVCCPGQRAARIWRSRRCDEGIQTSKLLRQSQHLARRFVVRCNTDYGRYLVSCQELRTGGEITVVFRAWGTFVTCPARWNRAPLNSAAVLSENRMNLRPNSIQPILRRCGFCIAIIALAASARVLSIANPSGEWQAFFPKCMFFWATGLHCPGCGCQRAIHHLFNGRILLALQYNALVITALPWLTWEVARASLLFLELPAPQILASRWRLSGKQAMSIAIAVMAFWILRNVPCRPFEWLAPPPGLPEPNDTHSQPAIPVAWTFMSETLPIDALLPTDS